MRNCITDKSIKLLGTYFKSKLPSVVTNNSTYEEIINFLYKETLKDFDALTEPVSAEGISNDEIILQHLTVVPQILKSYLADNIGIDNTELESTINENAKNIYKASQENNLNNFQNIIDGFKNIIEVDVDFVINKPDRKYDSYSARKLVFNTSHPNEIIFNKETNSYSEKATNPEFELANAVSRAIMATSNQNNFKLKLILEEGDASLKIVDNKGNDVYFDDAGNVTNSSKGKLAILDLVTNKNAQKETLKTLIAYEQAINNLTSKEASKKILTEQNEYFNSLNAAINEVKKGSEVLFEIDLAASSYGFIERNNSVRTKVSTLSNQNKLSIELQPKGSSIVPMVRVPFSNESYPLYSAPLESLPKEQIDFLLELLTNNNLKDQQGQELTKDKRNKLIQQYIDLNANASFNPIFKVSYSKGKVSEVQFGSKKYEIDNPEDIKAGFQKFISTYYPFIYRASVPVGNVTVDSIDKVTYNQQIVVDKDGNKFIAKKPSVGTKVYLGVSDINSAVVEVVSSINNDVVTTKEVPLIERIKETTETTIIPNSKNEIRAYSPYLAFYTPENRTQEDTTEFEEYYMTIEEANKRNGKNVPQATTEEEVRADEWLEESGWGSILKVAAYSDIHEKGKSFVASFVGNTIGLWKGSDRTAIYHEVFHAHVRGILSTQERKLLYQEILDENKGKSAEVIVNGVKKNFSFDSIDVNNNQDQLTLEEWLAEEFRAYARNRSKYNNKPKSKIAQFFEMLLERLRSLFGNHTYSEVVLLNSLSPKINAIFNNIYEGNVDFSKFENVKPNIEYFSSFEIENELSYNEISLAVESMNSLLYSFIDRVVNPTSNVATATKMAELLNEMARIPYNDKDYKKLSKEYVDQLNELKKGETPHSNGLFVLENNPELLEKAFDYILSKFENKLESLKENPSSVNEKLIESLEKIIKNFGDVSQPVKEFLNDSETVLGVFLNNYSTIQLEEAGFQEDLQNQTSENLNLLFDRTGAEQPMSELVDARTKELITTLPKYRSDGKLITNSFEVPSLTNLNSIIFQIANATYKDVTMKEMYDSLKAIEDKNQSIKVLLTRLGNPEKEGITKAEIEQWRNFWKSFAKATRRLRTFELEREIEKLDEIELEMGEVPQVKSITSKLTSVQFKTSIIKRDWSFEYQYNLDNPSEELSGYLSKDEIYFDAIIEDFSETVYVDYAGRVFETPQPNTKSMVRYKAEPVKLLEIFGIILPNTVEVNEEIRKGSNFIDAEFIDSFWKSINNRVTAYDQFKFPETLSDLFKAFTYVKNNQNQKQNNLSGYLNQLANLAGVRSDDYSTFMQKTPEGENQSTKPKHSSLSVEISLINSAEDYFSLITIPGMQQFDIEINPEVAANNTFVKMFNLDLDENNPSYGERNFNMSINTENLVGSVIKEGALDKGVKSISTDEFSKFTTDLYTTIENYQEIMRSEAKSTSVIVQMPTIKKGRLQKTAFSNEEVFTLLSENYKDLKGPQGLIIYELFKSHIESELVRINRIKQLKDKIETGELESVAFDQKFLSRGSTFIKFENILTDETKSKLEKLKNAEGELILKPFQLDNILTIEEKKVLETELLDYFKFRTEDLLKEFGEKAILSDNLVSEYQLSVDEDIKVTKDRLFHLFILNNFYNNLEYQSLFLGDPSSYNIKGEDYHKRIAGKISAGDIFLNEDSWFNHLNSEKYNKDAFAKKHYESLSVEEKQNKNLPETFQPRVYQGYLRTGIIAEAISESVYADTYKELFGFDIKAYNKQEEADGAAWIKFDTYRFLLDSIGEWSTGQEAVYQALLKGENIDQRKIKNTFPIKKFQYYGPLFNNALKEIGLTPYAFHKYSVIPLIPSTAIANTPLEDLHNRMMEENWDYIAMSSASKLGTISTITNQNLNTEPVLDNIYDVKNGRVITNNPITENLIHVKHLKSQVYLSEGFKGYISLPSQMRKISTLGLYSDGKPADYSGTKTAWKKLSESEKREKSKSYSWIKRYNAVLDEIRTFSRNNLLENIGLKEKVNKDGSKEYIGSTVELAKYIKQELTNKNLLPEEVASILKPDGSGELISDLSFSLNSSKIEEVLMTLVDNELRNLKFAGEGLVQMPGTMAESKFKPELASKEDVFKYGTNGLSFYHVLDENGKPAKNKKGFFRVAEAQVKIALQGDFMNLLYLDYKGSQIAQYNKVVDEKTGKTKKEFDFNASLARLNEALKDEKFFEEHKDKLRLVGPRIPTQAENSIESMVVKEFLPPIEGNKIILPSEIVAKAGSDYDIDKLFMMFPNIAYYRGEGVEIITYDKSITDSDEKLNNQLEKINEELKTLNTNINQLYANKTTIFENFQEIEDFVSNELLDLVEQRNELNSQIDAEIDEASKVYNNIGKYKKYTRVQQKEYHIKSTNKINELSEERNSINKEINDRIDEIALETIGETDRTKLFAEENKKIKSLEDKRNKLTKQKNAALRKLNQKSIKGLQNELMLLFAERVSFANTADQLLVPNSTDLFDDIANELEKKLNETSFYNKYNRGKGKVGDGIAGTTIYDYRYNLQKHQENSVGLRSLGIAAVTSTFYAIFTQMGAKLNGVSQAEQIEFTKALEKAKELGAKQNLSPLENAQLTKASIIIKAYKDYSLKIDSQKLDGYVSLSNLNNKDGITISNIIGQLINGYVDVAKKAWIYNVQGNLQNTPQLLFMIMAGAKVNDAVFLSSHPLVIEYNKMKAELSGVFANLTTDAKKPVILSQGQATKEARARMTDKYQDLFPSGIFTFNTVNKTIDKNFTSKELKDAALTKEKGKYNTRDIQLLAHYIAIEDMSNDITEFTMVNKFDTEKLQNLSQAQERIDQTIEIQSKEKSYANDWFEEIKDTPVGKFANDQFILDLLSKYFGVRNNSVVIKKSISSFRPKGVDKAYHYNNFKNDFIWFLFQNSIYRNNSYKDFRISENLEQEQAISIDGFNVSVNSNLIEKAIDDELYNLGLTGILDVFPTNGHYIRYEIERQRIEADVEEMSDEEFKDKFYYFNNIGDRSFTKKGTIKKMALFYSGNNVAMFNYTLGFATIFKNIQVKHRESLLHNQLFQDLRYDLFEKNANLFLDKLTDDDGSIIRAYKENLIELINSPIPEVSDFFSQFTNYALMQSGLTKGKYNLTRIIDESVFSTSIDSAYDVNKITELLDKYSKLLNQGQKLSELDVPYLNVFAELFDRVSKDENAYRTRGKGVNYISDTVENVEDGVINTALSYQNVGVYSSFKNIPAGFVKLNVDDIFNDDGSINTEYLESIQDEKIAILSNSKFIAPENGSQQELDIALNNYLNIDNSGKYAKALIVSKGQTSNNISISDSEILKKYSVKDEAMANSSTVAIGRATEGAAPKYQSSSKAYVNSINKKYPTKLAGNRIKFKSSDKVWIFGSGIFENAYKGVMKKEQWEANVEKTFNDYHKKYIDQALKAGVTTFFIGDASGVDQLALDYLKEKGFYPMARYTDLGKYYEVVNDTYKEQAVDLHKFNEPSVSVSKVLGKSFYSEDLNNKLNKLNQNELNDGIGYAMAKANFMSFINFTNDQAPGFRNKFQEVLIASSNSPIVEGSGLQSVYLERFLMEVRAQVISKRQADSQQRVNRERSRDAQPVKKGDVLFVEFVINDEVVKSQTEVLNISRNKTNPEHVSIRLKNTTNGKIYNYVVNPSLSVNNVIFTVDNNNLLKRTNNITINGFISPFRNLNEIETGIPSLVIEQNFADGSTYKDGNTWKARTMMPQFKGKSTMEMVVDGSRTRSTRSKTEIARYMKAANVDKVSDLVGQEVLMFDSTGKFPGKAVVKITNVAKFTQEYQDATWQKEGWTKDVTDRLVGQYPYAIEYTFVRMANYTVEDIKNAQNKNC